MGLVTDEKALYTGSTWGQAVGAGGQSWVSSVLYCLVRPAEEMSDVVFRAVCPPYVVLAVYFQSTDSSHKPSLALSPEKYSVRQYM